VNSGKETQNTAYVPSAGGGTARVIVCERTGRWAVALRRELADAGVRVYETRTLADCWQLLAEAPASFAVIELTLAGAEALLCGWTQHGREFPSARMAVVADRSLAGCHWAMREAGAVHFTCSPRGLSPLARLICRHLAQAPAPPQSLPQRIWAGLPWKAAARTEGEPGTSVPG
jgi:hypothetical protein